jgi:energy-converting hydrogenase Eha subunit E
MSLVGQNPLINAFNRIGIPILVSLVVASFEHLVAFLLLIVEISTIYVLMLVRDCCKGPLSDIL